LNINIEIMLASQVKQKMAIKKPLNAIPQAYDDKLFVSFVLRTP
jgi:hypothetical protein